jgi:hypothetical protein
MKKRTASVERNTISTIPMIRGSLPAYVVGQITPSGLRIAQDLSTTQLALAKKMYEKPPFYHPVVEKPPFRPKRRAKSKLTLNQTNNK